MHVIKIRKLFAMSFKGDSSGSAGSSGHSGGHSPGSKAKNRANSRSRERHGSGTAKLNTVRQKPLVCGGHSRPVPRIAYSSLDSQNQFFLISACLDSKPMLRYGQTGDWIGTFSGHKGAVWGVSLNKDATRAATGGADYTGRLWNAISGDQIGTYSHDTIVKTVDLSPDGQGSRLLTGDVRGVLRVFDAEQQAVTSTANGDDDQSAAPKHQQPLLTLTGHTKEPVRIARWMSEHTVMSGGGDDHVKLWDVRSGQQVNSAQPSTAAGSAPVRDLSLSLDQRTLCVASGKVASFFDAQTLQLEREHRLDAFPLLHTVARLDAGRFVVGGDDLAVRVYDYETGKVLETNRGHHGPVHSVRVAPDGQTYATGSEDGTVRLWLSSIKSYGLWQLVHPKPKPSRTRSPSPSSSSSPPPSASASPPPSTSAGASLAAVIET